MKEADCKETEGNSNHDVAQKETEEKIDKPPNTTDENLAKFKDIGESENWAVGLTYVGLSRVKTLNGLFLVSKGWSRYQKINDSKANKRRIRAEDLLRRREERVFGD